MAHDKNDPLAIILRTSSADPDPVSVAAEDYVAFVNKTGRDVYIEFAQGKPLAGQNSFSLNDNRVKSKKIKKGAKNGEYDYYVRELKRKDVVIYTPKMRIQAR